MSQNKEGQKQFEVPLEKDCYKYFIFEPQFLFMDHCECKYVELLVLDEYAYIAQLSQLAQEIHSLLRHEQRRNLIIRIGK